tara:strand:+ start:101 stop:259 length:159 start_codon:yes stop_codon:yes gene_type:complete
MTKEEKELDSQISEEELEEVSEEISDDILDQSGAGRRRRNQRNRRGSGFNWF